MNEISEALPPWTPDKDIHAYNYEQYRRIYIILHLLYPVHSYCIRRCCRTPTPFSPIEFKHVQTKTYRINKIKMSEFIPEFSSFLTKLSKMYSGVKSKWLRLLLNDDHCAGETLGRKHVSGIILFNELNERGYISHSPPDVEILLDIAIVTENNNAEKLIKEYKEKHPSTVEYYVPTRGKPLTEYRKRLFKTVRKINGVSVLDVAGTYQVEHFLFSDFWDLVFHLENAKLLENEKYKRERFAERINQEASEIFLGKIDASDTEQSTPVGPISLELPLIEQGDDDDDYDDATEDDMEISPQNSQESIQSKLIDDISKAFTELQNKIAFANIQPVTLRINRSQVVENVLSLYKNDDQLVLKPIEVKFEGEPGQDGGGLSKEMFSSFWTEVESSLFRGQNINIPSLLPQRFRTDAWKFKTMGAIFSHSLVLTGCVPLKIPISVLLQLTGIIEVENIEESLKESILLNDFLQYVSPNQKKILSKALKSFESLSPDEKATLTDFFIIYGFTPKQDKIREQILGIADGELFIKPKQLIAEMRKGIPRCHIDLFWSKLSIEHIQFIISTQKPTPKNVISVIKKDKEDLTEEEDLALHYLKEFITNMNNKELSDFLLLVTGSTHQPAEIKVSFIGPKRLPQFRTCGNIIELPTSYEHLQDLSNQMTKILRDPNNYKTTIA